MENGLWVVRCGGNTVEDLACKDMEKEWEGGRGGAGGGQEPAENNHPQPLVKNERRFYCGRIADAALGSAGARIEGGAFEIQARN